MIKNWKKYKMVGSDMPMIGYDMLSNEFLNWDYNVSINNEKEQNNCTHSQSNEYNHSIVFTFSQVNCKSWKYTSLLFHLKIREETDDCVWNKE